MVFVNNYLIILIYFLISLLGSQSFQLKSFGVAKLIRNELSVREYSTRLFSTVIAPPKVDKPVKIPSKAPTKPSIPNPDVIWKESRDIEKEFNDYIDDETYFVVLYNDPFNKRAYVASVLMEIFNWSESLANDVMLQAHNNGFAVTGEYGKEVAIEYCKKLLEKGLYAEARKSDDTGELGG